MTSVIDIGKFGLLHKIEIPYQHPTQTSACFVNLTDFIGKTPCNTNCVDVTHLLEDQEKAILRQNCPRKNILGPFGSEIYMSKGPDSVFFHDKENRFHSMLHAPCLYMPRNSNGEFPPYTVLAHVVDPHSKKPVPDIHLVMHEKASPPHHINFDSPFAYVDKQMNCLTKLEHTPKELFNSKILGNFHGRMIKGPQAHMLKQAFMQLSGHFNENGRQLYAQNIKLVPEISELMMFRDKEGNISLHPAADCMVACRKRKKDGCFTFLGMYKSDDYKNHEISDEFNSKIQGFKLDYLKKQKDTDQPKRRITFIDHPDEIEQLGEEFRGQTVVNSQMSMQEILDHISHAYKRDILEQQKCHQFHEYIQLLNTLLAQSDGEEDE